MESSTIKTKCLKYKKSPKEDGDGETFEDEPTTMSISVKTLTEQESGSGVFADDSRTWVLEVSRMQLEDVESVYSPPFLGVPMSGFSNGGKGFSWICTKRGITSKFVKIAKECFKDGIPRTTVLAELPLVKPVVAGTVDTAILTHVQDPSEFYIVLETEADYYLDSAEWKKFFPAFGSGPEALWGITKLLEMFYNVNNLSPYLESAKLSNKTKMQYQTYDLVAVKFVCYEKDSSSAESFNSTETEDSGIVEPHGYYQIRRGLVTDVFMEDDEFVYSIYLLDFGIQILVSDCMLFPLPRPFNCIGALAIQCGLFGVSPVGENWNALAANEFHDKLESNRTSVFSVDIMSSPSRFAPMIVNLETRIFHDVPRINCLRYGVNFAEELVYGAFGLGWNLFPTRPKLMKMPDFEKTDKSKINSDPYLSLTLREAMLLTAYYPRTCDVLPKIVLEREIKKLFRLRRRHLVDILGLENRLAMVFQVNNPNELQAYVTPCSILKTATVHESLKNAVSKTDEEPENRVSVKIENNFDEN